jgi:hypothetical protein
MINDMMCVPEQWAVSSDHLFGQSSSGKLSISAIVSFQSLLGQLSCHKMSGTQDGIDSGSKNHTEKPFNIIWSFMGPQEIMISLEMHSTVDELPLPRCTC